MIIKIQSAYEAQKGLYYEYDDASFPLGTGGMGTVYQGRCFREGDRSQFIPVAIKKLSYNTPELIRKAMNEASVKIDNDNLIRMFAFIPNYETDPATNSQVIKYYVVMELLEGVNLDNLINGKLQDIYGNVSEFAAEMYRKYAQNRGEFVKEIMANVFNGVKALHADAVIHRDLDPSNVMITADGKIKVIDFGISKKLEAGSSDVKAGSMMGKVDYAAPEMIKGEINVHNFTTDIYALGIMAYQLLTGSLPFNGTREQIADCQLKKDIPLDKINDFAWREIISKSTQKDQANRFQHVEEMEAKFAELEQQVLQSLCTKEFNSLSVNSSFDTLNQFLSKWKGYYDEEVRNLITKKEQKIKEEEEFEKIKTDRNILVLSAFLRKFPYGDHYKTVMKWKEEAMFNRLTLDSPLNHFDEYLNEYNEVERYDEVKKLRRKAKKHQRKPISVIWVVLIFLIITIIGVVAGLTIYLNLWL